tara:strand:+ start:582 stop:1181 length:600 start_codon:yes stop_codon:yes gene_type:complete
MSDSQTKKFHTVRYGTAEGEQQFGHVHEDGECSATMLRNGSEFNHYFSLEATGKNHRKGGTISQSPGSFQVKAGSRLDSQENEDEPGIYLEAESGDIVILAPSGKVRIEGIDVEIKATGASNERGNIILDSNEKILCRAQMIDVSSKILTKIFSEGTVDIIGKHFCDIFGGYLDLADAATSNKGSQFYSRNEEKNRGTV